MKILRYVIPALLAGTAVAVVAQQRDEPESLLPPGFDTPAPSPSPHPAAPRPAPTAHPATQAQSNPASANPASANPASAQTAGSGTPAPATAAAAPATSGAAPTGPLQGDALAQAILQRIMIERPRYDIPPGAQRSLNVVGVIEQGEGGLDPNGFAGIDGAAMRTVLTGTNGPILSRWGQILLRRALLTRQPTPIGLQAADWAALRADLLLRMGEADAARALVQQVDVNDYTPALNQTALGAYSATSDFLGLCPIVSLGGATLEGDQWYSAQAICSAFGLAAGNGLQALDHALNHGGGGQRIDILLAQKFAGAANQRKRALTIDWTRVSDMTPWRYGLSLAVGVIPPETVMRNAGPGFAMLASRSPVLPPVERAKAADSAAARGVMSSRAMIDLYSMLYGDDQIEAAWSDRADKLHDAYAAPTARERVAALRSLWTTDGSEAEHYSRMVAGAYAAARIPPQADFSDDAGDLLAAMLSAGLDRNAARWAGAVEPGTLGWALVAVGRPDTVTVSASDVEGFAKNDPSDAARKTRFLAAGLAGLGRMSDGDARSLLAAHGGRIDRGTRWTHAIDDAAARGDALGVAYLAGLGMQGSDWSKMTSLYLYHIVAGLRRVGMEGEARMIAAEAVARA